jgi:hypothetical protein
MHQLWSYCVHLGVQEASKSGFWRLRDWGTWRSETGIASRKPSVTVPTAENSKWSSTVGIGGMLLYVSGL